MERIFFQDWFVLIFLFLRNVKQTRFFAKACFLRIIDTVSSKSEEKTVDERIVVRIFLVLSLVLKMYWFLFAIPVVGWDAWIAFHESYY